MPWFQAGSAWIPSIASLRQVRLIPAIGIGWQAKGVDRRDRLDAALAECLASDGPYFLDVHVTADENCFPMIPAGRGHHEMLLGKGRPYREHAA